jgi:hypothetical protein
MIDPSLKDWVSPSIVFAIAGMVWRTTRRIVKLVDRLESVLGDYPPHRHVNGAIVYPHDYAPPEQEELSHKANGSYKG